MQKQLITDQLIEEYQKELEIVKIHLKGFTENRTLSVKESMLQDFIEALQSLRQQEVQNVIDAYLAGVAEAYPGTISYEDEANDYFTQTFEQKGGENEKE